MMVIMGGGLVYIQEGLTVSCYVSLWVLTFDSEMNE